VTILSPATGGKSIRVQAKLLKDPLTDTLNALAASTGIAPANVSVDVSGTRGTFSVAHVTNPNRAAIEKAIRAVGTTGTVTVKGSDVTLSVPKLPPSPQDEVTVALAKYAHATPADVTLNTVGPTWGSEVSHKALVALIVFFIVLALYLAIRFEPKMSAAAIIAVLHDIAFTVGVYAIVGFPVTPATVTAFLTILGFSLYDTVVVFDKVDENGRGLLGGSRYTYGESANLAVNQTLMRSINTSLIGLLPVAGLLFVGAGLLGVGTLKDLALVLFVGMLTGAYSSLFLATPWLVDLKMLDQRYKLHAQRVLAKRAAVAKSAEGGAEAKSGRSGSKAAGAGDSDDEDLKAHVEALAASSAPRVGAKPAGGKQSQPRKRSGGGKRR
jgi:preprotein translocase subunit SecF